MIKTKVNITDLEILFYSFWKQCRYPWQEERRL